MDVTFTAYWESAAGVPLVAPGVLPTIRIRRLDTNALVVTDSNMTEVGDGIFKFIYTPTAAFKFSARADGDPTAISQVPASVRYNTGSADNTNLINYGEASIWVDTTGGGSAGSVQGVNGTQDNPVDNIADMILLLAALNIKEVRLAGSLTLTQTFNGYRFRATEGGGSIDAGSQDCANCIFDEIGLTGIFASTADMFGTAMAFFGTCTNWRGTAVRPGMAGTIICAPGEVSTFAQGASIVAGVSTPSISVAGVGTQLNLRAYSGGMFITDMDDASSNASLEFTAGQCILEATNILGTIVVRGIVSPITDNSAGSTINIDAAVEGIEVRDVWRNEGLDVANPKTITVNSATDMDEDVADIHKDSVTVGTTTTQTRT